MSLTSLRAKELPYLSHIPTDGRSIPPLSFLDKGGTWHAYVSQPDGTLFEVRPVDAIAVFFLSQAHPPTPRDAHLPLFHLVVQHFSFKDTWATLEGIKQDYLNGLASLHKYFVLSNYAAAEQDFLPHVIVGTELEFAFSNHRAFYDLIHKLTASIYRRALIEDGRGRRVRPANMPDSFSRVLQKSDADLASKYHLPAPLVAFYRGREDVFRRLCKIRDNIIHHGHSTDFVFSLPDGFALSLTDNMWADLHTVRIWPTNLVKPNGLASVLGLLVFLLDDMETAMTDLVKGLVKSFTQLPQPLAKGYNVHLRDHLLVHRLWLTEYREQQWCDPASVLQRCASEWSKKPCAKQP
jgi:hypothetical protein